MHERNYLLGLGVAVAAGCYGFIGGNLLGKSTGNGTGNERVELVQQENYHVDQELISGGHKVVELVLNDQHNTFVFNSTSQYGQSESCTGQYKPEPNNSATIVGKLACTIDVPVK